MSVRRNCAVNDGGVENPTTLFSESTEGLDRILAEYEKCEQPRPNKKKRKKNKHRGSSIPPIYLFFLKANLGVGLLSLPKAISNSGILAGSLVIIAISLLLAFCAHTLMDLTEFAQERKTTSHKLKRLKKLVIINVKRAKRRILFSLLNSFQKKLDKINLKNFGDSAKIPSKYIEDIEVGESSRATENDQGKYGDHETEIWEATNIPAKFVEDIEVGESSGAATSSSKNVAEKEATSGSEMDDSLPEVVTRALKKLVAAHKETECQTTEKKTECQTTEKETECQTTEKETEQKSSGESLTGSSSELTESEKDHLLELVNFVRNLSAAEMRYNSMKQNLKKYFFVYIEEVPFSSPSDDAEKPFQEKLLLSADCMLKNKLEEHIDNHFDEFEYKLLDVSNEKMQDKELKLSLTTIWNNFLENFIHLFSGGDPVKGECSDIVEAEGDDFHSVAQNVSALQLMMSNDTESSDDNDVHDEPLTLDYRSTIKTTLKYGAGGEICKAVAKAYLEAFIFSLHFLGCCTSFVFVADTLQEVGICGHRYENGTSFELVSYASPFVLSLILVSESGDDLTAVVFIACMLQMVGLVLLMIHFVTGEHSKKLIPYAAPLNQWPLFFSSVLYAFEGTGTFYDLQGQIRDRQTSRHHYNISMFLIVILYILVSVFGYWKYGDDAMYSITFNLPESSITNMVQVMTALGILLAYPFHMSHLLQITKSLFNFHKWTCGSTCKRRLDIIFRLALFTSTFLFSVYVPELELQMLLSGGVFVALLIIITPQLLYLGAWESMTYGKNRSCCRVLISMAVVIVGLVYLVWSGLKLRQLFPQFYLNFTMFG